jgi:asparagine synthase (glutamine-hydrolysing)
MCGIVGSIVTGDSNFCVSPEYLIKMRDTMVHRGPDGAGLWISADQKVGLGHRRLSIIDLSESAAQPMKNEKDEIVISFNGEIYNHADIRNELNSIRRINWKTDHSDTEVILRAYETWGIACIHRFRGMFGIALWDSTQKRLILVRDRMGIKPVYYSNLGGRITFASEIKALLEDPDQERRVNEEAFFHYLSFLTTPAPMTLFEGINKLEPGTYLTIDIATGSICKTKYYELWENVIPVRSSLSEDEIANHILSELREAVTLRKVGDVPIGVFLSGGIDSSSNAALFSENQNGAENQVKTFSIGYNGEFDSYKNELHFAKLAAEHVGAKYHEKLLTQDDLIDFLPEMVRLQDEPIADPVCVPVYYVSKLARENGVTVCQVGEGADELYWGYPTWKLKRRLQQLANIPGTIPFQKVILKFLQKIGKQHSHEYEALRRSVNGQPIFWGGAEAFTEFQKQEILSPRLKQKFKGKTSWEVIEPIYKIFQQKTWEKSILHWMTYLDLSFRLPELLLMRIDKMSMGVSLECRVPFLDHKFVEYALGLSEKIKTKKGILKYALKKAVRGVIPDKLINRKKQGFGVPVYEWLFDRLGDQIRVDIKDFCSKTDFIDHKAFLKIMDENPGPRVWYLYNFVLWWNEYIDRPEKLSNSVTDSI